MVSAAPPTQHANMWVFPRHSRAMLLVIVYLIQTVTTAQGSSCVAVAAPAGRVTAEAVLDCSGGVLQTLPRAEYTWNTSSVCGGAVEPCTVDVTDAALFQCEGSDVCTIKLNFAQTHASCASNAVKFVAEFTCGAFVPSPPPPTSEYVSNVFLDKPCSDVTGSPSALETAMQQTLKATPLSLDDEDIYSVAVLRTPDAPTCDFRIVLCCRWAEALVDHLAQTNNIFFTWGNESLQVQESIEVPDKDDEPLKSPIFLACVAFIGFVLIGGLLYWRLNRRGRHPTLRIMGDRVVVEEPKRSKYREPTSLSAYSPTPTRTAGRPKNVVDVASTPV